MAWSLPPIIGRWAQPIEKPLITQPSQPVLGYWAGIVTFQSTDLSSPFISPGVIESQHISSLFFILDSR